MNKIIILLCLSITGCNISKKLSSHVIEHKELDTSQEIISKNYLDSLFRSHIKISIAYTKENYLPDSNGRHEPGNVPDPTTKQAQNPGLTSREQVTINFESDTENHVQKGDSLSSKSATQTSDDFQSDIKQAKDRSVSWKFYIWISVILVVIAGSIYCIRKKINPFVKLLKLIQKWL